MYNEEIKIINQKAENFKEKYLSDYYNLTTAMHYSLALGGKRVRPCLLLAFYKLCGGKEDATDFALALEMIHTYSLIHDDLPCMDNDDFRRGHPSCHKKFGESTALLAGDALLTDAFNYAVNANIKDEYKIKGIKILSKCAGVDGMIGGQAIDLYLENNKCTLNEVLKMYELKTCMLLIAACTAGAAIAGASENEINAAKEYAYNLGIAFQIRDDILDIEGDEKILGKPIGSDEQNNKNTYVSLVGLDKAKEDVKAYTQKAVNALNVFKTEKENKNDNIDKNENIENLILFANSLINRNK